MKNICLLNLRVFFFSFEKTALKIALIRATRVVAVQRHVKTAITMLATIISNITMIYFIEFIDFNLFF